MSRRSISCARQLADTTLPASITPPDRKEVIEDPLDSGEYAPPVVLREPAFLATCRQIRSETSHVFYGENHFSVRFALYGPKFVRQLGPERTAMLTSLTACGVEQARWVTSDRLMHAAVWHVNRLLEAAGGALHPDAVLVPVGHGAIGGWQRLTEAKDMCVVDKKGEVCVEWVARALEPALSIFEY